MNVYPPLVRGTAAAITAVVLAACAALTSCSSSANEVRSAERNDVTSAPPDTADESAAVPSLSISEPDPDVTIGTLDNGLRYMIRENDNPGSRVTMKLVVDAGAAQQDVDQDGVAHFVEHMMFNGTEQFPENDLVATLRSFGTSFGADVNAYTSFDETVYDLTMPTQDDDVVSTGLDVLEQWLSAATIDPAQVESERGVVLDEWRRDATGADARIFTAVQRLLLSETSLAELEILGAESAITSMSEDSLRTFYDTWYRPDNAAVIVVGDIDADDIERQIGDRFESLTARVPTAATSDVRIEAPSQSQATVLADPDVAEAFASVYFPMVTETATPESDARREVLDAIALDIVSTRLSNAALRGEAPFDEASIGGAQIMRGLLAAEVTVEADADDIEASTQAVLDELERIRRFGVGDAEFERSVASLRTAADSAYDGRDSRQDADFASEYVEYVLEGSPIPTADARHDFTIATLDKVTPDDVTKQLVGRLDVIEPQILVVVPASDAGLVPSESTFVEQVAAVATREIDPLVDEAATQDQLMVAPDPIEEVSTEKLGDARGGFIDPVVLEFANGVRVALNVTDIADGEVAFEGRSPGGRAVLADADVPAGDAISTVINDSGVGTFDTVELDAFLADKDLELTSGLEPFAEVVGGRSTTADLEVFMQLLHLQLTQPVVDPLAVTRYVEEETAYAADPSVDAGYAEFVALTDARFDDPRYLPPTVESLATVEAADIERVFRDRFGDASDWSFSFSGDLDVDDVTELARRYLGTLPASGREEVVEAIDPPPPAGLVEQSVASGDSSQATVSLLFTEPATTDRRDDVAAQMVQELVSARLTDVIRETLGESYSPYASIGVGGGPRPYAETYMSTTTSPELVDEVTEAILAELDDLATNGSTDEEFDAVKETVLRSLDLFGNEQINSEVLAVLVDPAGNESLQDFIDQSELVSTIDRDDLADYVSRWIDPSHHIVVTVVPR